MCWVDEFSGPEEHELGRAWDSLNRAFDVPGSRVRQHTAQSIASAVQSVNTLASMVREAFPKEHAKMLEEHAAWRLPDEQRKEWFRTHPVLAPIRAATLTQSLFIFVRALQDAAYSGLLESDGQPTHDGTSMNRGLEHRRSTTRCLLEARIPGYVEWFSDLLTLRNDIKQGLDAGGVGESSKGFAVHFRKLVLRPNEGALNDIRALVYLDDVARAVEMSAKLLRVVEEAVRAGGTAPLLRVIAPSTSR